MCMRREAFEAVGGFREGVGRIGTIALGCEETELCIRLRQSRPNTIFMYEPRAVIFHQVPAQRARWQYFRRRCFAEGMSKALIAQFVGPNDALTSERAYTLRILPRGVLQGLKDAGLGRDWTGLCRAAAIISGLLTTALGYGYGLFLLSFTARKKLLETEVPSVLL
jgi:hypothetical protein